VTVCEAPSFLLKRHKFTPHLTALALLTLRSGTKHQLTPVQHRRSYLDALVGCSSFQRNVHFIHLLWNVGGYSLHHGPFQLGLGFAFLDCTSVVVLDGSKIFGLQLKGFHFQHELDHGEWLRVLHFCVRVDHAI